MVLLLTDEQTAAVISGLRLLQKAIVKNEIPSDISDILTNGGELDVLSDEDIDGLCEEINCSDIKLTR